MAHAFDKHRVISEMEQMITRSNHLKSSVFSIGSKLRVCDKQVKLFYSMCQFTDADQNKLSKTSKKCKIRCFKLI